MSEEAEVETTFRSEDSIEVEENMLWWRQLIILELQQEETAGSHGGIESSQARTSREAELCTQHIYGILYYNIWSLA